MADSSSDSDFKSIPGGELTPSPNGSIVSARQTYSLQGVVDRSEEIMTAPDDSGPQAKPPACERASDVRFI